ncbi:MAG: FliA/WhiG family RNA polymerase sigma factor [Candidatus Kapabacteria bacterium]|nr:FliA/WhiG family RNA polymerase sigma factor [Candidatus Kapabacteria bacterium]
MAQTETITIDIWEKYVLTHTIEIKHKLVLGYIWLVKYVLQNMSLPINTILTDEDFLSIGILALHEAIERFEPQRGIKFESYSIPRIKGMIQDELRRLDWLSRTARKKAQDFLQASDSLRSEEGREVSTEEIRKKLNVSPEKYNSYLAAAAAAKASFSIMDSHSSSDPEDDDYIEEIPDVGQENYLTLIENEERIDFITDYIKALTERKRLVMTLYYYENLTFREIGTTLSVSESRICQIHTQVVNELRTKLIEFDNA